MLKYFIPPAANFSAARALSPLRPLSLSREKSPAKKRNGGKWAGKKSHPLALIALVLVYNAPRIIRTLYYAVI